MPRYLRLTVPLSDTALVALSESGTLGIEEDAHHLHAFYPEDASLADLARELGGTLVLEEDADWSSKWREKIRPIRVGPFVVVPPWLAETVPADNHRIVIDSDMAFGTGDHATTRSCIALLVRTVKPGAIVLDFGCGSGILAITAARLGAGRVVAVDCDERAVVIAGANAALNNVTIEELVASEPPEGVFDVIVANIQSTVLEPMLVDLKARVRPGGYLLLAGLLSDETLPLEPIEMRTVEAGWQSLAWRAPA